MATNRPVRPLPTALQTRDSTRRRSRISFTSGESSNNHSVESSLHCFGSNASSQTSHSSTAPLPKGARPPSPQSSFAYHCAQTGQDEHIQMPPKRALSSSWRVEWRGLSRMIKWAVLGEKVSPPMQGEILPGICDNPSRSSISFPTKPLSPDKVADSYDSRYNDIDRFTSPSALCSAENSSSCLNLHYECERITVHSGMGHSFHDTVERPVSSISHQTYRTNPYSVAHAIHVQSRSTTNVHNALPEHGQREHAAFWEPQGAISEPGHAMLLNSCGSSSSYFHPDHFPTTRSDIGHGSAVVSTEYPSGMASTSFISNGFPAHASSRLWPHSNVLNSTVTLPVSTGLRHDFLSMDRRRPRKLQKTNRMLSVTQSAARHRPSSASLTVHGSSPNRNFAGKQEYSSSAFPSTFPVARITSSQPPRPHRKLTKKPSPQLPSIPNPSQSDVPPPVPPKPISLLKNKNESPLPPLPLPPAPQPTPNHSSDSSVPALTNTSHSTSSENEIILPYPTNRQLTTVRSQRPSILRTESNRRWTVAVADVPDDMFIEEFERLRRMGMRTGEVHGVQAKHSHASLLMPTRTNDISNEEIEAQAHDAGRHVPTEQTDKEFEVITIEDELEWTHARKAIMCCRELVRTERSYQTRLQELLEEQVCDAVPKLLLQYLPALISASKILSSHLNEDMSTTGVSYAFIQSKSALEDAFIAWSGVVGEFFGRKREIPIQPKHKRGATISSVTTKEAHLAVTDEDFHRSKSMQSHEEAYITPATDATEVKTASGRVRRTTSMQWLFRPAFSQPPSDDSDVKESFLSLRKSFRGVSGTSDSRKRRKPPFRELAILPTQRITRYVLLYKDLLKHTTTSSQSSDIVERAVKCAESLARMCDRAQDNAAFLH